MTWVLLFLLLKEAKVMFLVEICFRSVQMISPSLADHPVAWNPAEALLAWQHGGPAPRTGHCLQPNQLWQRAGQEAGGVRAPGDPDLRGEAGGSPQEAAHHKCGTRLPHQVHGLRADQTSVSGMREWKAPKKKAECGGENGEIWKSESHEENLVPLSRHGIVWGQLWRIIRCIRKRREFAWKIWDVSIWVIPRWCKSFLCPHSADNDESFSCKRVGCVGDMSGGCWKETQQSWNWFCHHLQLLVLLEFPAGGTGRVKCLLFCSQKIGF